MSFLDPFNIISQVIKATIQGSRRIKALTISSIGLLVVGLILAALSDSKIISKVYGIIGAMIASSGGVIILGLYAYQRNVEEIKEEEKITAVEIRFKENPNEPTAAWELARVKLENYLNRNLLQVRWIFIWTVIVMIGGFGIIGFGIMKAYDPSSNIGANIITTCTGLLIEFLGATFLIIYKSTIKQAKDYVTVLERINAVGMSVQILDSISKTELKLQDQTKAEIAKRLLELYSIK